MSKCIAFIPARSGSKRIPNKNIKMLNGHPLLAYTIKAALNSTVFSRVIVSTDSQKIADIAKRYGAEIPYLRPKCFATDSSPDIEWVLHIIKYFVKKGECEPYFSILRPTSPFRQPETIRRAWNLFISDDKADSLRAVEKCTQHPAKMWKVSSNRIKPILNNPNKKETPWHSQPYQNLPEIYVQNASLEIAKISVPLKKRSITGNKIKPFFTKKYEGYDLNNFEDWIVAEYLIKNKLAVLPKV